MAICVWCALFVTSQFDVIFLFPNQSFDEVSWHKCIFFCTHSPSFMCHCTEYKLLALQVRIPEENKLNTTTQQFRTPKILGCALKQGSKTHSSTRKRNLPLQIEVTLMSWPIRAVDHRCAAGLSGAYPGMQDRILLNHARIENAHNVRKKKTIFVTYRSPANFYFSSFPAETLSMPECSYAKLLCLSSCNSSIMLQKLAM